MVFSEPIFLFFFFPITYLVYRLLPGMGWKNGWLALTSLVFFSFGQLPYTALLLLSVGVNYIFGLWLLSGRKGRKGAVALAVTVNLLLLGVFKYLDFVLTAVNGLFGLSLPLSGIVLPIGISFYTFQGMSYVIDVYRNPAMGTRSAGKLLLYISFFPQLIAGPIVIYHSVARQIERRRLLPALTLSGLERLVGGLAKKLLLADTLAVVVDGVYALEPGQLDARLAWAGAICYTLQLYFDFSGYSDMAIGLGRLFGFRFPENFRLPYTARSIQDFWRRWHISLSTWFRDYLYIPLGGNRKGSLRTTRNKLIVFFATGLWHGANWTFVLWGLWHGLFLILEDRGVIPRRLRQSRLGCLYTMLVVVLGFLLFRSADLGQAGTLLSAMATGWSFSPRGTLLLWELFDRRTLFLLAAAVLLAAGAPQGLCRRAAVACPRAASAGRVAWYSALFLVSVLTAVSTTFSPFLYFHF